MITQTITLQMVPTGLKPRMYISQRDTGARKLRFILVDGSSYFEIPSGTLAFFSGVKCDKKPFDYAATWSGHTVEVDVTDQMSNVPGLVECELRLMARDAVTVLGSANLELVVERMPLHDCVCSKAELKSIDTAVIEAREAVAQGAVYADQAEAWAQDAKTTAESITFSYIDNANNIEQLLLNKTS